MVFATALRLKVQLYIVANHSFFIIIKYSFDKQLFTVFAWCQDFTQFEPILLVEANVCHLWGINKNSNIHLSQNIFFSIITLKNYTIIVLLI